MALGMTVIIDLVGRLRYLSAHYSDDGVLPRFDCMEFVLSDPEYFSIHYANGATWFQGVLFLVTFVAAVTMIVGYRSRLSTLIVWFLLLSLHNRNPLILNGGDNALRLFLFWAFWMPIGAAWSVDARRSRPNSIQTAEIFTLANIGFCLQLMFIYLSSGFMKTGEAWMSSYTAVRDSLLLDHLVTPLGKWIREHDWLTQPLTYGTIILERYVPFALLIPLSRDAIRTICVISFVGLHIGIAATMSIYGFSLAMAVAWLPFVPHAFWERAGMVVQQKLPRRPTNMFSWMRNSQLLSPRPMLPRGAASNPILQRLYAGVTTLLVVFAIATVIIANLRTMSSGRTAFLYPTVMESPARFLGLRQNWKMFAPYPSRSDKWPVLEATLSDDSRVNLWDCGPVSVEKPDEMREYLKNRHWRKLTTNAFSRDSPVIFRSIADYFVNQWRESSNQRLSIESVNFLMVFENTEHDGSESKPRSKVVWSTDFGEPSSSLALDF